MYALRYCSNMPLVRSVCPSVYGWNAVLSLLSMPSSFVVSFHRSEVNRVPLSVMISCGSPCSRTISLMKRLANCRASRSFEHGMKWLILVSRSMTTSMVSYPSDFGRSVMKSIAMDFHGRSGASFDCNSPYGACRTTFIRWHVSQFLTKRLMSSLIFGQ